MARTQYFVTHDAEGWRVLYEMRRYGPYGDGSREQTLARAIESAREAVERGFEAEVLVADGQGGYERAWPRQ